MNDSRLLSARRRRHPRRAVLLATLEAWRAGFALGIPGLAALGPGAARAQAPREGIERIDRIDRIDRITVADEAGDHGLPTPYTHAPGGMGYVLTSLVFDTLVWRDADGASAPALARAWRAAADGLSVEFTLRDGLRWHDGRPIDAADVAFTFAYVARHRHPLFDVAAVAGVDDLGGGRLRVRLHHPYAPFMAQIAGSLPILPRHVYAGLADPARVAMTAIVGSGPYRLTGYDKAAGRYLFAANDAYYLGAPKVRSLLFVRMEPALAPAALRRGEIDIIRNLPLALAPAVVGGATVIKAQSGHPVRLRFNHARPPFGHKRARQALARGIDRAALLRAVEGGQGEVSVGRFVRGSPWQTGEPMAIYPFDRAAARAALPAGLASARIGLITARGQARLAAALAAQIEELGVRVDVRIVESAILAARLQSGDFDLALVSQGSNGDPESMLRQTAGHAPFSDDFRTRADLVDLLQRQVGVTDPVARRTLLDRAQAIYADELPAYFLYAPLWAAAANDRLRPWFTPGGLAVGIPVPLNKLIFVR